MLRFRKRKIERGQIKLISFDSLGEYYKNKKQTYCKEKFQIVEYFNRSQKYYIERCTRGTKKVCYSIKEIST